MKSGYPNLTGMIILAPIFPVMRGAIISLTPGSVLTKYIISVVARCLAFGVALSLGAAKETHALHSQENQLALDRPDLDSRRSPNLQPDLYLTGLAFIC